MTDQYPQQPGGTPPPPPPQPAQGQPYGQQPPAGQPYGHQPPGQAPYGHQPPYAAPPPPHSQVGQPADLMTRFLARLIDNVIIGIAYSIVSGIVTAAAISSAMSGGGGFGMFVGGWVGVVLSLLIAAISLGYFALMESSRGQTLGKMIMKIKTFGPGGANPTMNEALKRNIWTALPVLGVIPLVGSPIGSLLMLGAMIYIAVTINNNTSTRQGWHDTFAGGTTVIKVG